MAFYGEAAHSPKQLAFMQFLAQYGKTYATKSDMTSRFSIFSENYDRMTAHNSASDKFKMGVNHFFDMTTDEFSALYGTSGLKVKPALA